MKAHVKWTGDMRFVGESDGGHTISMDSARKLGERNLAPSPMEMILIGLGGCNSFDIVKLLKEAGQDVHGVDIHLEANRANTVPAVFTHIKGHYTISGCNIDGKEVEKAIQSSANHYSSVSRMLEKTSQITYDYEIKEIRKEGE